MDNGTSMDEMTLAFEAKEYRLQAESVRKLLATKNRELAVARGQINALANVMRDYGFFDETIDKILEDARKIVLKNLRKGKAV